MGKVAGGKFACEACGKQFTWKPQLAGKKAKCSCGVVITVPESEEDALVDLLGPIDVLQADPLSIAPPPTPEPAAPRPARRPRVNSDKTTLGYRTAAQDIDRLASTSDAMMHRPRDVYVPVGLLVTAVVALMAWAAAWADAGGAGAAVMVTYLGAATLIKVVVLTGLALIYAPMVGISFGTFWTAVLKLAAILIFSDVALIWLRSGMETIGAARPGRISLYEIILMVLSMMVIVSLLSFYLFEMDGDEVKSFALPLAFISFIMGLVLNRVAVAILEALLAPAAPAPAPAPPPAAGQMTAPAGPAAPAPPPLR